jgi:SNF2 family DNA or RNA helicase
MQLLVSADNVCGRCGEHINGLRGQDKRPKPCERCGWKLGLAPSVDHVYPLDRYLHTKSVKNLALTTGTPILNSPDDIYPLLHLIDPIQFVNRAQFTSMFCMMNYASGKLEFRHAGLDRLKQLIRGRYIGRTIADTGVTLPEQHIRVVRVDMDPKEYPKQLRVVQQISSSARIVLESGDSHNIMHLMTLILRKRQANVWPAGIQIKDAQGDVVFSVGSEVQESCKIDAVCENIARQHARGKRQIVFSQFQTALVALEARLRRDGYRVARFDGSTPDALRAEIKHDFYQSSSPRWDVVLVHYRSGGTGLNLQQATVTHILDEEWNPGRRDQAYARTHRMGQSQETEVFVYRVPGGVDSWMANLIRRKEKIIGDFAQDIDTERELREQLLAG